LCISGRLQKVARVAEFPFRCQLSLASLITPLNESEKGNDKSHRNAEAGANGSQKRDLLCNAHQD